MTMESSSLKVPEHLNSAFFSEALNNGLNTRDVNILKLEFSLGSAAGDNYLSNIYRIVVTYTLEDSYPKEVFLITKCVPNISNPNSMLSEINVFNKERFMYLNILPQLEDILVGVKLVPKCYYAIDNPIPTFAFEDMKAAGYSMSDRVTGLNEEHCQIALYKLGQYHAASILLLQKNPKIRDSPLLQQGIFSSTRLKSERFQKFSQQNLQSFTDHIDKIPEYEEIVKKLRKLDFKEFVERVAKAIELSNEDTLVLGHGDMWVNNLMFKYDEDSPTDIVMIDFQGSAFVSLGLDINYFFATSPSSHVRTSKKEELIEKSYYLGFKQTLEKHAFNMIPSLGDIKKEVQRKELFELFCSITVLPIISMSKDDSEEMSVEKIREGKVKPSQLATKRFLEVMKNSITTYDKHGLLDTEYIESVN